MRYKTLITASLALLVVNNSFATNDNFSTNNKIKAVNYSANNIVKLNTDTLVQTMIELNKNEDIQNISIGDSTSWNVTVPKNTPHILFIKPNITNGNTNMTIITDKNTYHFDLSSNEADKTNIVYHLKFNYQNQYNNLAYANSYKYSNYTNKNSPDNWNWQYSYSGNKNLVPKLIFDDKEKFTYFKFKPNQETPAIYINKNGKDELVNYRIKPPYVVIEKLSNKFTIRYGNQITHIFNEQGRA
tara:strand:- start:600 stop:1328 length:729 start_codon:yes stop_codon:yes gene_type:complete